MIDNRSRSRLDKRVGVPRHRSARHQQSCTSGRQAHLPCLTRGSHLVCRPQTLRRFILPPPAGRSDLIYTAPSAPSLSSALSGRFLAASRHAAVGHPLLPTSSIPSAGETADEWRVALADPPCVKLRAAGRAAGTPPSGRGRPRMHGQPRCSGIKARLSSRSRATHPLFL